VFSLCGRLGDSHTPERRASPSEGGWVARRSLSASAARGRFRNRWPAPVKGFGAQG
jgi:hypothetical protein